MKDTFETNVELTLTDLAKVDRSTIEEVRASIALLPDRRSSRLSRIGRSISTSLSARRPAFALAGAAVIVVAIVALSLFGRFQSQPVGPGSPTPSTTSPRSTGTPEPSGSATPSTTERLPAVFQETLPVVLTGKSLWMLGWAPDGSRFAVLERPTGSALLPPMPTVHLFDRTGAETGSIEASLFAWLSPSSYVILRFEYGADGILTSEHAFVGRIGSADLTAIAGNYYWLISGPSGAVALMKDWDGTLASLPQYVVLSGATPSAPRGGYPTAWSRDGSMLAVFHPTNTPPPGGGGGGQTTGWLEVVRPTGESVASARKIQSPITAFVAFSPDGARVALDNYTSSAKPGDIGVLNVGSGRVDAVGVQVGGEVGQAFTWAGNDELLIGNLSWSAKTGKVTNNGTGDVVGASGRGLVVIGSNGTHTFTWTNTNAGAASSGTFSLGASTSNAIPDRAWSPDGRSLILIAADAGLEYMDMDAVIFRP